MMECVNKSSVGNFFRKSGGTACKRPDVNYFDIGTDYGRFFSVGKGK